MRILGSAMLWIRIKLPTNGPHPALGKFTKLWHGSWRLNKAEPMLHAPGLVTAATRHAFQWAGHQAHPMIPRMIPRHGAEGSTCQRGAARQSTAQRKTSISGESLKSTLIHWNIPSGVMHVIDLHW